MDRIQTTTKAADLFGPGKHGFRNGDPAVPIPATHLDAGWFNQVQEELAHVIESTGTALDPDDRTQLATAITAMIGGALPDLAGYLRDSVNATLQAGFYVTPAVLAITAGTVTPVLVNRNVQTLTVDEAITLANPATIPPGGMAVIYATQDASGGHGITWGSAYRICNGNWSTDPDAVNILWLTTAGGGIIDVAIAQRGEG